MSADDAQAAAQAAALSSAKIAACSAAVRLTRGDRQLARTVLDEAEMSVMRRLAVATYFRGDEAAYWREIEQEISR